VIDTLLAATALEHDLYLVTRNVGAVGTSGAQIFDPWMDDTANFPLSPMQRSRHWSRMGRQRRFRLGFSDPGVAGNDLLL
jgi:hypothetical protein